MESRCMILIKEIIKKIIFRMSYAWCSKLLNFDICRHYSAKFINHLFVKLIILNKPHLNVSHIQELYENDII
jgi:hypothetical protein